ncbi:diaminopimelate decarboxylase [Clostridium sp. D2Q-11]|uniref:Diaminopimelate decarboxylase n=1 Tax=Anaeromonas frigoriresistens TaxID=2683708 RepID=A0A942UV58_9FIRM|nr:diaminopimelate decarboxylase [Anaeromonas frigoriresistens]MBS4537461.1 diaminopimelate decarboxylase [Anaeromonas frigoriresistens]
MTNKNANSNLIIDGCDTVKLAKEFGTPLYVVSQQKIEERCREIYKVFLSEYKNTRALYASKSFLTMAMCKIVEKEGLGLDVVSGGELYTALKADFPTEKIIFHGNNKSYEELYMAIENEIGRIVVDNFYEFELIEQIALKLDKKVNILYRITPGVNSDTHKYITTGQKDSKFGIPLEKDIITDAVKKALSSESIGMKGFHFHVGSQLFDNTSHIEAVDIAIRLMKELKDDLGYITEELNTGGGYGIPHLKDDIRRSLKYFIKPLMDRISLKISEYNLSMPEIMIEPGRWIVGEAGTTLYTIGSIKEIPGLRTYVAIDGGMTDNPRPSLYGAKYYGDIANKMNKEKVCEVTIAGKCCESGDILMKNLEVPHIVPGDILAVYNTGAYNFSMASNYNRSLRSAVVLINNGQAEVMVERQGYEDLLRGERIPKMLSNKEISPSKVKGII